MGVEVQDSPVTNPSEAQPSVESSRAPAIDHLLARGLAALCLALTVLAGTASLTGVVEGTSWLPYLIFPVVVLHLVYGLIRGIRVIRWLALPAAALVALAAVMGHDAMDSNAYGLSPMQWFFSSISEAGLQLTTQVPPVASSAYIDLSILVLALVVSLLTQILATFRRTALLAVIPLSFAPIVASLFKQEGAGIGFLALLVVGVLGYVALLPYTFTSVSQGAAQHKFPPAKTLGVFGITALACIGSLFAASLWMPGFRAGMFPEGKRPSGELLANNVDPLINLGRDLRSNGKKPFLTYYTSADQAPYLRTQVITDLTQQRWEPSENLFYSDYYGDTAVTSDYSSFGSSEQVLRMTWPNNNTNPLLPLPTQSYFVQGIQGDWRWTHETSVARLSGDALSATKDISVAYEQLQFTPELVEELAGWGAMSGPSVSSEYSRLPTNEENSLQPLLRETLDEAYADGASPDTELAKAAAIQDFFRSGKFAYSERTPLREGYDGANAQVVEAFLDRRQGYCVHFASAMALLAREAGIPSRIAVGYAPGVATGESINAEEIGSPQRFERTAKPGTKLEGYTVSGQQAHAWPELFITGLGWVPFEPTPGRGYTPSYAPEATRSAAPSESTAPEVPTTRSTPTRTPSATPSAQAATPQTSEQGATNLWLLPVALVLIGAVLCIGPWRRNRIRQERLKQIRAGTPEAAQALWAELLSVGADAKLPAGTHESVGDYTVRLSVDYPALAPELQQIQQVVEQSFYADRHPGETDDAPVLNALHRIQEQLRAQLSVWQRLTTFFLPPSLRSGIGGKQRSR